MSEGPVRDSQYAAMPAERIHSLLRRMAHEDWLKLKSLMSEQPAFVANAVELEILERLFRRGEAIGGSVGGIVLRLIQTMVTNPVVSAQLREINERIRAKVRFILREMSDADWAGFMGVAERCLPQFTREEELKVLELVFRLGESVSNVEVAALALEEESSTRKLIDPEIARRNASLKARVQGGPKTDPEEVYRLAKKAIDERAAIAARAANTLAYRFAKRTQPYKHARNTVFKWVDHIAEQPELMERITWIYNEFEAVSTVSREQMRWALHRMPVRDRLKVIRWIPLNTVLVFQERDDETHDVVWKSARDRRLAYDLFVQGRSDEELAIRHGLSINAVKNAVGAILHALTEKPLARKVAAAFIQKAQSIEPMGVDEIRRRMKRISTQHRAEILDRIPNCAWKAKDVIHLHKHLFLDYFSGEWVLASLVAYYNLEKGKRLTGTFKLDGTLTVRGACAAIEGVLHKIKEQPVLREMLREFAGPAVASQSAAEPDSEPKVEEILPVVPERNGKSLESKPVIPGSHGVELPLVMPVLADMPGSAQERAVAA